jgi:hypothetical protein
VRAAHDLLGDRVGYTGTESDFNNVGIKRIDPIAIVAPPVGALCDGVAEEFDSEPLQVCVRHLPFDEEQVVAFQLPDTSQTERVGV